MCSDAVWCGLRLLSLWHVCAYAHAKHSLTFNWKVFPPSQLLNRFFLFAVQTRFCFVCVFTAFVSECVCVCVCVCVFLCVGL